MTSRVRWLIAGLIVVAAATVALWPRSADPPAPPGAPPAPDLAAARAGAALQPCAQQPDGSAALAGVRVECLADGSTVDLAGALAGRPMLVNVWATWCPPCKEELPILAGYAAEPGAVPVLGLAVRSDPAGALELLTALRVRLPTLLDHDDGALRALKVPDALPASFVIESDGTVHFVTDPRLFRSVDQVRQTVARYLPPGGNGSP